MCVRTLTTVLALAVGLVLFWSRTQALALGDPVVIETVTIGNPGNGNDIYDGGFGGVDYVYNIGKYEVTAGQYTEFLNAVAADDTYGLYNTEMWTRGFGCKIERTGTSGSYEYSVRSDWADRPVNYVGWGDAARFANWLQNGQPTGAQNLTTTEDGSYFLNGAMTNAELVAIAREPDAIWVIPSEDEWYKAAYYDKDSVTWNYFTYPTSNDSPPSNDLIDPDPGNSATYEIDGHDHTIGSPYWRTEVGAHENSASPYGTFDQGGNVWEWNEGLPANLSRGIRGGSFWDSWMHAASQSYDFPTDEQPQTGFRVAEGPFVPIPPAKAECSVNEGAKLIASDAAQDDLFGRAVAISGDMVVVGAPWDDDAGEKSGSAYAYRYDGSMWIEEQKLTASDAIPGDEFGTSVSLSGDVTIIGSYGDDDAGFNSGSAYIYRFDGSAWVEEQKLTASDAGTEDRYGNKVSVSGDVAVVGAFLNDDACPTDLGCNSGSAYVYRFNGSMWVEEAKLTAGDAAEGDLFGISVAVSGDVVVVGVFNDDDACPGEINCNSGSAYVFRFNGRAWVQEQKLTASDAGGGDGFGIAVSISEDVAVIGAFRDSDAGFHSGSAYVYRLNGRIWVEEQKLTASDASEDDSFGGSVSVSGDVAVVGSFLADNAGSPTGSAYVYRFDRNSWVEEHQLIASHSADTDWFGISVSVSGDVGVVGASRNDDACPEAEDCDTGSVYMFGLHRVASNLPCRPIDARQPSSPDGGDPGSDSITMTFDEPPGEMNAEDFAVVISPPGDAPSVIDVTVDGNTATVHLDGFLPTQVWATLTHWPTGAVMRIGFLPADVNNDRISNANDVLFLIDVLNGIIDPAPPAYQTDTDRSGATNANDVLRVIDLLNGAGAYDEYLGAELPT